MADVAFTTYAFAATDTPTSRTLPNRLAEIHNVRDFGAKGDGVHDDWAAIMAAFNNGQVTLVASGTSTGTIIPFTSVPSSIIVNTLAINTTNSSTFPYGANVEEITPTSIRLQSIDVPVQAGDVITFNIYNKGTIYFPPGTYLVTQPINAKLPVFNDRIVAHWLGQLGNSTIIGDFADYVLNRGDGVDGSANANGNLVEKLTIINTNADGGGIRLAMTSGGAIRNCLIIANKGITTIGIDNSGPGEAPFGSLEISIENCALRAYTDNASGSQGISNCANGVVLNCQITNYEKGYLESGGEGATFIAGCYFEHCGTAFFPDQKPNGGSYGCSDCVLTGSWFKNNGTAINFSASATNWTFSGLRIEAYNGQAPSGGNPQYGMIFGDPGSGTPAGTSLFAGITVLGDYATAGISFQGVDSFNKQNTFVGVQSISWDGPVYADSARFISCNAPDVYTMARINSAPFESTSFNVSDSNSATWGATAAGSGSIHAKVRYNGSNWTVVGK